jgi:ABC-type Fe3+ transport system permease subunit
MPPARWLSKGRPALCAISDAVTERLPERQAKTTCRPCGSGIAAGSIFTFSLTLGDYVAPDLVGGNNHDFIGNVIFRSQGVAQDLPFAAAYSLVPLAIILVYLFVARRLGAFEAF